MRRTTFTLVLAIVAAASAAAAEPPELHWEVLTVDYDGSETTFDLGRLSVPEDRGRPDGARIDLAFVRLPATGSEPGPPLVYLSGGPGQPATPMVRDPDTVAALAPLRALGDLILLDQRGTGLSRPGLFCPAERPPHPELFVGTEAAAEDARQRFAACAAALAEQGIDLLAYDTAASADDLDDLRRALGADKLRLLGFSYGTHLALAAVRRHGERLDRVVLVGTEGPDHTWKLPSTADAQVARLGLLAAADPDVGPAARDLHDVLRRVLARLDAEPLQVTLRARDGDSVTVALGGWGLRRILLQDLGDSSDLPWLPALIHQLDRPDAAESPLLGWFLAKRYRQYASGLPAMSLAMDCASWVSPGREAVIRSEAAESLFGNVANDLYEILCPVLGPAYRLDEAFREPVASDVPVLLVSGTLDHNTPPFQAEEVRWGLSRGLHLVVENAGHEDLLTRPEVQRAIGEFLVGGTVSATRVTAPPLDFVPLDTAGR